MTNNKIVISLPTLDELALKWPAVEPLLRKVTERTACYEPIDLLRGAMAGQMGIWVIERGGEVLAALVTQVRTYPRKRLLEVPFVGGRGLRLWHAQALAALDDYARKCECSSLLGFDRRGWLKFGFRNIGVIMQRDVTA